MARPLRIEYEGAYYHVVQRGHERKEIFRQDKDYQQFLLYLVLAHRSCSAKFHAYCLMSNHYHLIIETLKANLSKVMHLINTGYSVYYNKKYRRVGSLYQGRYKSLLIEADEYLHHVSRYIHLNPVRAKIVERPEDYKWSTYSGYIKNVEMIEGVETGFILSRFGKGKAAKMEYRKFVEDEMDRNGQILRENTIKGLVIGGMDFLKEIKEKYIDKRIDAEIPMINDVKKTDDETMLGLIDEEANKVESDYKRRRKMKIYFARRYTQYGLKEIAKRYGEITYSGISQICRRVEKEREKEMAFDQLLNEFERKMSNVKT